MADPTPSEALVNELEPIIRKYILLRRFIDAQKEQLTQSLKEYEKNKNLLSNYLGAVLNQSRLDSVSTSIGTAFTSSRVDYRVADKTSLLRWILQQNDPCVWELFDIKPIPKEIDGWANRRLRDYIDYVQSNNGEMKAAFEHFVPPGLSRVSTTTVKVRKKGDLTDDGTDPS